MPTVRATRTTMLVAALLTATAAAAQSEPQVPAQPSFRHDVIPLLTRLGCNSGTCHGKTGGKNGFSLSLRGYAPEQDHHELLHEVAGRRVNLKQPEQSLMLLKPLGDEPHEGGTLFQADSPEHRLLLGWIRAGALPAKDDDTRLEELKAEPGQITLAEGDSQSLRVTAKFSNGESRDVTWMSRFASDAEMLAVDQQGNLRVEGTGEGVIRASFGGHVAICVVTVPRAAAVDSALYAERRNVIDEHVFDKLAALQIEPSPACSDAEFIRRVYLDLIGTLPTSKEVSTFLNDKRADKRRRLVQGLLQRPEWLDYWTLFVGDLLQNRRERQDDVRGKKDVRAFNAWLRMQLALRRGWDQLVAELLTAEGDTREHPEVGYLVTAIGREPFAYKSELPASVAQTFLGTRIGCAKCHNHPLEKYTQDDYYRFAALFSRMSLRRENSKFGFSKVLPVSTEVMWTDDVLDRARRDLAELPEAEDDPRRGPLLQRIETLQRGRQQRIAQPVAVQQPRTEQMLAAQPLDAAESLASGGDPRAQLVEWMRNEPQRRMAGSLANRLWKHFMGVGLIEPVDDLRPSNPPSNGPLYTALVDELIGADYSLQHLMRLICTSRAYQLSSQTRPGNVDDRRFYSRFYVRRLPAEVLLDAISYATGVPQKFPGYPLGLRAVQLPEPAVISGFLDTFGRDDRATACACSRSGEVTLQQLLVLQNGDEVMDKIRDPGGRLATLDKIHADNSLLTQELFLSTVSRYPRAAEMAAVRAALPDEPYRIRVYQDLLWAILNSKEFVFNR